MRAFLAIFAFLLPVAALAQVPNRNQSFTMSPMTTEVGTTPTAIFPAGDYMSIRITLATPGARMACTGDGTKPMLGVSPTVNYEQWFLWPSQPGGGTPGAAVSCVASIPSNITTEAH